MFGVAGLFALKLIVDDEAFLSFTEPEFIAKFYFGSAFSALEDLDVWVVEAEDLLMIAEFAPADDAFVGLFDGGGKLGEDVFDTIFDLADVPGFEVGLGSFF